MTTAKLNTNGLRWISELANYDFSIKYRKGKKHIDADFLSRNPIDVLENLKMTAKNVVNVEDVSLILTASSRPENEHLLNNIKIETM